MVILFGKYKNRSITDLPSAYLEWLTVRAEHVPKEVKCEASLVLEQRELEREQKLQKLAIPQVQRFVLIHD